MVQKLAGLVESFKIQTKFIKIDPPGGGEGGGVQFGVLFQSCGLKWIGIIAGP